MAIGKSSCFYHTLILSTGLAITTSSIPSWAVTQFQEIGTDKSTGGVAAKDKQDMREIKDTAGHVRSEKPDHGNGQPEPEAEKDTAPKEPDSNRSPSGNAADRRDGQSQSIDRAELRRQGQSHQLNKSGVRAFDDRNYAAAIDYFQQALAYGPNNSTIRSNLLHAQGLQAFYGGDHQAGLRFIEEAVKINSDAAGAAFDLQWVKEEIARDENKIQRAAEERTQEVANTRRRIQAILGHARITPYTDDTPATNVDGLKFMDSRLPENEVFGQSPAAESGTLRFMSVGPDFHPPPTRVHMIERAAELVAILNRVPEHMKLSRKPVNQREAYHLKCQAFFRTLGVELRAAGKTSWDGEFAQRLQARGIIEQIQNDKAHWERLDGTPEQVWQQAQERANGGDIVIGGYIPRDPKKNGHLVVVTPTPPDFDRSKLQSPGTGPFVRDGNDQPSKQTGKTYPLGYGTASASKAMPLTETTTHWYVWIGVN